LCLGLKIFEVFPRPSIPGVDQFFNVAVSNSPKILLLYFP
jgi:hypothetical protein